MPLLEYDAVMEIGGTTYEFGVDASWDDYNINWKATGILEAEISYREIGSSFDLQVGDEVLIYLRAFNGTKVNGPYSSRGLSLAFAGYIDSIESQGVESRESYKLNCKGYKNKLKRGEKAVILKELSIATNTITKYSYSNSMQMLYSKVFDVETFNMSGTTPTNYPILHIDGSIFDTERLMLLNKNLLSRLYPQDALEDDGTSGLYIDIYDVGSGEVLEVKSGEQTGTEDEFLIKDMSVEELMEKGDYFNKAIVESEVDNKPYKITREKGRYDRKVGTSRIDFILDDSRASRDDVRTHGDLHDTATDFLAEQEVGYDIEIDLVGSHHYLGGIYEQGKIKLHDEEYGFSGDTFEVVEMDIGPKETTIRANNKPVQYLKSSIEMLKENLLIENYRDVLNVYKDTRLEVWIDDETTAASYGFYDAYDRLMDIRFVGDTTVDAIHGYGITRLKDGEVKHPFRTSGDMIADEILYDIEYFSVLCNLQHPNEFGLTDEEYTIFKGVGVYHHDFDFDNFVDDTWLLLETLKDTGKHGVRNIDVEGKDGELNGDKDSLYYGTYKGVVYRFSYSGGGLSRAFKHEHEDDGGSPITGLFANSDVTGGSTEYGSIFYQSDRDIVRLVTSGDGSDYSKDWEKTNVGWGRGVGEIEPPSGADFTNTILIAAIPANLRAYKVESGSGVLHDTSSPHSGNIETMTVGANDRIYSGGSDGDLVMSDLAWDSSAGEVTINTIDTATHSNSIEGMVYEGGFIYFYDNNNVVRKYDGSGSSFADEGNDYTHSSTIEDITFDRGNSRVILTDIYGYIVILDSSDLSVLEKEKRYDDTPLYNKDIPLSAREGRLYTGFSDNLGDYQNPVKVFTVKQVSSGDELEVNTSWMQTEEEDEYGNTSTVWIDQQTQLDSRIIEEWKYNVPRYDRDLILPLYNTMDLTIRQSEAWTEWFRNHEFSSLSNAEDIVWVIETGVQNRWDYLVYLASGASDRDYVLKVMPLESVKHVMEASIHIEGNAYKISGSTYIEPRIFLKKKDYYAEWLESEFSITSLDKGFEVDETYQFDSKDSWEWSEPLHICIGCDVDSIFFRLNSADYSTSVGTSIKLKMTNVDFETFDLSRYLYESNKNLRSNPSIFSSTGPIDQAYINDFMFASTVVTTAFPDILSGKAYNGDDLIRDSFEGESVETYYKMFDIDYRLIEDLVGTNHIRLNKDILYFYKYYDGRYNASSLSYDYAHYDGYDYIDFVCEHKNLHQTPDAKSNIESEVEAIDIVYGYDDTDGIELNKETLSLDSFYQKGCRLVGNRFGILDYSISENYIELSGDLTDVFEKGQDIKIVEGHNETDGTYEIFAVSLVSGNTQIELKEKLVDENEEEEKEENIDPYGGFVEIDYETMVRGSIGLRDTT